MGVRTNQSRWFTSVGGRRRLTERGREAVAGYAFASPWLAGVLLLTVVPALSSFYFSFTDYPLVKPPSFVGTQNYQQLFTADSRFVQAIGDEDQLIDFPGLEQHPATVLRVGTLVDVVDERGAAGELEARLVRDAGERARRKDVAVRALEAIDDQRDVGHRRGRR